MSSRLERFGPVGTRPAVSGPAHLFVVDSSADSDRLSDNPT